jgi:type I restriction enzyme S subunit
MRMTNSPELWQESTLGRELIRRNERVEPSANPGREWFYVGLEHIEGHTGRLLDAAVVDSSSLGSTKNVFHPGDILYGKLRPYLNKVYVAQEEGVCSTDIWVFQESANIDKEYAAFFLRSSKVQEEATRISTGANLPRIDAASFGAITIPLPPLPEQRRIVAILRQAEEIRRKRREAEEKADKLSASLFNEMFPSFTDVDSEPLSQIAQVVSGVAKGRRLDPSRAVLVPYLRVANVQDGYLDLTEIKTIEALPNEVEELRLERDDVLLTEGGDHDKLGRGAIWKYDILDCIHQNHIFRVRADRNRLEPLFFSAYLQTPSVKDYFFRSAKKTTNLASINMTQLRALSVPLPSLLSQQEFAARVTEISALQEKLADGSKQAETLFQSLLSQAFSRELTAAWRETHTEELAAVPETVIEPETLETRLEQGRATPADLEEARQRIGAGIGATFGPLEKMLSAPRLAPHAVDAEPFLQFVRLIEAAKQNYTTVIYDQFIRALSEGTAPTILRPVAAVAVLLPTEQQRFTRKALQDFIAGHTRATADPFAGLTPEHVTRVFQNVDPDLRQAMLEVIQQATEAVLLLARIPDPSQPRYHLLRDLSAAQYEVYLKVQSIRGYVTPEMLHGPPHNIDPTDARRGLQLLARSGIIQAVSLPTTSFSSSVPTFVDAYRALRPEDDGSGDFDIVQAAPPAARRGSSFAEQKADVLGYNRDPNDRPYLA